jgi:hypothetical protein
MEESVEEVGEKKKRGGRKLGSKKYSFEEAVELRSIVEEQQPKTFKDWKTVTKMYNRWATEKGLSIRKLEALRAYVRKTLSKNQLPQHQHQQLPPLILESAARANKYARKVALITTQIEALKKTLDELSSLLDSFMT